MATISNSVRSAMKMTQTVSSAVNSGSKIVSRGSFFCPESTNAFMEKHQQKNTPNSTWNTNSWSANSSTNSNSSQKYEK
jgi:hypothetical protein